MGQIPPTSSVSERLRGCDSFCSSSCWQEDRYQNSITPLAVKEVFSSSCYTCFCAHVQSTNSLKHINHRIVACFSTVQKWRVKSAFQVKHLLIFSIRQTTGQLFHEFSQKILENNMIVFLSILLHSSYIIYGMYALVFSYRLLMCVYIGANSLHS